MTAPMSDSKGAAIDSFREALKPYHKLVLGGDDLHHKDDNLRPAHRHIDIPETKLLELLAQEVKRVMYQLAFAGKMDSYTAEAISKAILERLG